MASEWQWDAYRAGLVALEDAEPDLIREWQRLEERAVSGNAFLSPSFILPAYKHLGGASSPLIAFVHRLDNAEQVLVALGVFTIERSTLRAPFPHLASFRSCHTFGSGFLVDRTHGADNLRALLKFLRFGRHPWHAIDFSMLDMSNEVGGLLKSVLEAERLKWHERSGHHRAMVDFRLDGRPAERISASLRNELARKRHKLQSLGQVATRLLIPEPGDHAPVERFLELEHAGWKGGKGSSLKSRDAHVRFFEEMTRGFSERGKALFCELLLDGKVIASSSNYVSGSCVLAFKIGWDPDFARFSPGRLAELAIIEHLSAELPEVDRLDSGSAPGSYVERMWLERHYLSEGMIATSRAAGAALSLLNLMRQLRRRVRGLVAKGRGG